MEDIAAFLGAHPPFDVLGADELARIAAGTETETTPRGQVIFSQGAGPAEYVWMVRSGSVEVIHDGRVLDLLGPGELFGHASMISGLPTGFEARAAEDTVCYRIQADVIRPLLARPDVLRFVVRSIVSRGEPVTPVAAAVTDPGRSRVSALIRTRPLLCQGSEPVREAARRMTDQGASAVLMPLAGSFGIVTDRDLRTRVIGSGLSPDAPVSAIMTAPAYTVTADRLGGDVLLVPAADRIPARLRGRALGRAARAARHQARRADPDRGPGPLGRDGGRRGQRLDAGAAARGRGGRDPGAGGGADAVGGVRLYLRAPPGPSGRAVAARRAAGRLHRPQGAEPAI